MILKTLPREIVSYLCLFLPYSDISNFYSTCHYVKDCLDRYKIRGNKRYNRDITKFISKFFGNNYTSYSSMLHINHYGNIPYGNYRFYENNYDGFKYPRTLKIYEDVIIVEIHPIYVNFPELPMDPNVNYQYNYRNNPNFYSETTIFKFYKDGTSTIYKYRDNIIKKIYSEEISTYSVRHKLVYQSYNLYLKEAKMLFITVFYPLRDYIYNQVDSGQHLKYTTEKIIKRHY